MLIWLQFVSDMVNINHLRLAAIGEFQVARSLQLSDSLFSIHCGCSFLAVGMDNHTRSPTLRNVRQCDGHIATFAT